MKHSQRILIFRLLNQIKHGNCTYTPTRRYSCDANTASRQAIQMHHGQVNVSLYDARDMIYKQFPQYNGIKIEKLEANTGTVNSIFRVGTEASARFPLQPQYGLDQFVHHLQMEAAAMTEFADHCCLPSPKPIGIGQQTTMYPLPWSVQTWVEGSTNTVDGLARSSTFTSDLVQLIKSMRSVGVQGRVFDGCGRGGRISDHTAWMETCFSNSETLLDVPTLRSLWGFFRGLPPSEGPDVMSHKDLIPMNILVRGEHVVGVLDTGSFGPADRALDLVAAWHMLESEQRQVLRKMLGVEDTEWLRGAAWAFEQAMGLVWYYEHSNPVAAALGRSTLRRLLQDEELKYLLGTFNERE